MKNMMQGTRDSCENYREESPKIAVVTAVVAVMLVGAPLVLANKKIDDAGNRGADVSKYAKLVKNLDNNVQVVQRVLEKGIVKESVLAATGLVSAKGTTLITPPVVPTNRNESTNDPNELNVVLSAIYWNPRDPLVTIDNENYYVGDKIKGFTILEIRKTEVVFRSPAGEKVVKYFYDYLDQD